MEAVMAVLQRAADGAARVVDQNVDAAVVLVQLLRKLGATHLIGTSAE